MTSTIAPAGRATPKPPLRRGTIVLMAVACGATVANLYYAQPLLSTIADAFGVSDGAAGLLVTVSQLCYAAGLILIVPLGDLLDRRRLVGRLLVVCSGGLVLAALAPAFAFLALALGVVATTSVVVQILIPFASTLAPEAERGRVVGVVVSGSLTGILLARTFSGVLAGALGWRAPFVVAAVAMAILAVVLSRALPKVAPSSTLSYGRLLGSILALVRAEPVLRRRMVFGACSFGSFTIAWTSIAFLLSGAPFDYGEQTIGLFGLAGLAGAAGAQGFGRLNDRGAGRIATGAVLVAILVSWGLLAVGTTHALAVVIGLIVLDLGVQGQTVLSRGDIYALGAVHASRVTTAYTTAAFAGGAIGSAAASIAWSAGRWPAVCATGAVAATIAIGFWLIEGPRG